MNKLRIAVFGFIVRGPYGGLAWHHLHYLLGLNELGHEVMYFEDSDDYVSCYDPKIRSMTTDPRFGLGFLRRSLRHLGLPHRWAYFDSHLQEWHGCLEEDAIDFLQSADLMLNVSGVNPLREWSREIPIRVLLDTDPVFTQIKILENERDRTRAGLHNRFCTFGESLPISMGGIPGSFTWFATRQPVYLPSWPLVHGSPSGRLTTVMQWESYPPVEHAGRLYGMKSSSFVPFVQLPSVVRSQLQLSVGGNGVPSQTLRKHGWSVRNSLRVTRTPWEFQNYVQRSKGEFTVAKHGYVVSNCGWFSERSANYLASGRPVITQETGFSQFIPTGEGLFAFATLDEAVAAIEAVESNYERHCKAAREIAEEYFDSRKVLTRLLDDVMSSS